MKLDQMRGAWALVTGASAGIGREYARQLGGKGINLVLVARREARMVELAEELEKEHGIQVLVIVQDLSAAGAADVIVERVRKERIPLRMLINNAAFGRWGRFEDSAHETYRAMLQVNVIALVELTRAILPILSSSTPSAIVNVASAAAYQPVPYMAAYAASKAFVLNFSQALYGEWLDRGVLIQALVPGATDTEFDQVAGAYASALQTRASPVVVVEDSIAALERESPVALNAKGTFKQRLFSGLFPPKLVITQVAKMFRPPTDPS